MIMACHLLGPCQQTSVSSPLLTIIVGMVLLSTSGTTTSENRRPNFLLIMADDLGIGDLGCYGNTTLRTPNIDRLRSEGVQFTEHIAAASVCTPSRAAFLTGRYPIRTGLAAKGPMPAILLLASRSGLPPNEVTFAKLLRDSGYRTAIIGKWHLGVHREHSGDFLHHPVTHGFQYFYGLPLSNMKEFGYDGRSMLTNQFPKFHMVLQTIAVASLLVVVVFRTCGLLNTILSSGIVIIFVVSPVLLSIFFLSAKTLNSVMMKNFDVVEQPVRLETVAQRFAEETREFLFNRTEDSRPFLLFLSLTHVHTALVTSRQFQGQSQHGLYGDTVEEMDWLVGHVLNSVDEFVFRNNTIVYFASDNGAHIEDVSFDVGAECGSNGPYKGGKSHGASDGGIRVPGIMRWPGHIEPNTSVAQTTSLMDIFPTVLAQAGVTATHDMRIDGKDLTHLMSEDRLRASEHHRFLYHYCGGHLHAVRYVAKTGPLVYKLVFWRPDYIPGQNQCHFVCACSDAVKLDPHELYELTSDPGEAYPLDVTSLLYERLIQIMLNARDEHVRTIVARDDELIPYKQLWRPWLQPCCNFPWCNCMDEKYRHLLDKERTETK